MNATVNMTTTEWLTVITIILTSINVFITINISRSQRASTTVTSTLSAFLAIEKQMTNNPELLRFHGISKEMLAEQGFSVEDFSYLVESFTAGSIYHRATGDDTIRPFEPGHYRYNLLLQEDTRRIWPFLSKMLGPSKYKTRVENTIKTIEQNNDLS